MTLSTERLNTREPITMPAPQSPTTARRMLRELLWIALMVASAYGAVMLYQWGIQSGDGGRLPVGTPLPAMELPRLEGGDPWRPADLRGRPAVLQYWATYCGVCRRELPALEALHLGADDRYQVLTITSEAPARVRSFLAAQGLDLPVLLDETGAFRRWVGVEALPTTVIIDAQGRVVHDFEGAAFMDLLEQRLLALGLQDG